MSEVFVINFFLLCLVGVASVHIIQTTSLFAATMLMGVYSLLMALVWSNMHALDVAFTEAAVGAGISTVLLLGCLVHTGRRAKGGESFNIPAFILCVLTGAALVYGTLDMPKFGDPNAPIHQYRVPQMLAQSVGKVDDAVAEASKHPPAHKTPAPGHHGHPHDDFGGHSPNTVTSLLASYRGFDTMFETAVIFTAGVALILLLRRREDELPILAGNKADGKANSNSKSKGAAA